MNLMKGRQLNEECTLRKILILDVRYLHSYRFSSPVIEKGMLYFDFVALRRELKNVINNE